MDLDVQALQRLLDKQAIHEASLRYTRGIDRHDVTLALAAYHADATDDHGAFIGNPEGFVRYANAVHDQNWVQHQHYVTNQTIDLDGDTAHGETYFLATLQRSDGVIDLVGGRYVDRFEKRDGCWAVADRACLVEWSGELPPGGKVDGAIFLCGRQDESDISYDRPLRLDRQHRDLSV